MKELIRIALFTAKDRIMMDERPTGGQKSAEKRGPKTPLCKPKMWLPGILSRLEEKHGKHA
jgi:hypothetical protein